MATLTTMRGHVQLMCGNKTNIDSYINDNIYTATIQLILEARPQEMWREETFTTTSGKSTYDLTGTTDILEAGDPAVLAILMVRDTTDDIELLRGSPREYNRLKQDTSVSTNLGDPRKWTRIGNYLVLYSRIPDSTTRTIKLTYLQNPGSSWTTFPLNEEWVKPVERLAAALTWADLNDTNFSSLHMSVYRALLGVREKPEEIEDEAPEAQIVPVSNLVI